MHLGIQFYIVRTAGKHVSYRGILTGKEWKTMLAATVAAVEWQRYQIIGCFVEYDVFLIIIGRANYQIKFI